MQMPAAVLLVLARPHLSLRTAVLCMTLALGGTSLGKLSREAWSGTATHQQSQLRMACCSACTCVQPLPDDCLAFAVTMQ